MLTDRRLLLFERGKLFGGVKGVVAAWQFDDVAELKTPKTRGGSAVSVRLTDGRRRELEFPLNKTDPKLAQAWARLRP